MKKYNIVFVVAHPDDEALWVGGTLNFLNKFDFINVNLICMTGGLDKDRSKEFKKVTDILNLKNSIHVKTDLPTDGNQPIENSNKKFYDSIEKLNLKLDEIDLIITHSMYGDEHTNNNHTQLFYDMYKLSIKNKIPFGFFSFLTMPYFSMMSMLKDARMLNKTHLINLFRCYEVNGLNTEYIQQLLGGSYIVDKIPKPEYYMQIKADIDMKKKLLDCYQSIDVENHKKGYYAWNSFVEGIYFMEEESISLINQIVGNMDLPSESPFRVLVPYTDDIKKQLKELQSK